MITSPHQPSAVEPSRSIVQWDVGGETFVLDDYIKVDRVLGSGAYGLVCEVTDERTHQKYAIKKCKNVFSSQCIALRTLREMRLLRLLSHEKIITLQSIIIPEDCTTFNDVYVMFELMEADLSKIIRSSQPLSDTHLQYFMGQLISALVYLHGSCVIHRDLKPKNLLINSNCVLKVADFGLARCYSSTHMTVTAPMTDYVTTRWYRAPEVLGGWADYTSAVDMWSCGTILAELLGRVPIFPGKNTVDQFELVVAVLGNPDAAFTAKCKSSKCAAFLRDLAPVIPRNLHEMYPFATDIAITMLLAFLTMDPTKRITAVEAMEHPYFAAIIKDGGIHTQHPPTLHINKEFDFEKGKLTIEKMRAEILREIFVTPADSPKDASMDTAAPAPSPILPPKVSTAVVAPATRPDAMTSALSSSRRPELANQNSFAGSRDTAGHCLLA